MADSLLDFDFQKLLLGAEPPNPVAGFLSPEQERNFKDQQTADMLYGALGGYGKQLNQGKGIASKLLGTIQGARQGRASTGNVYLDALKGQMALTKGMGDIQKTGAEIKKLGFENADLERMDAGTKQALLQALLRGDMETVQMIQLAGGKAYGNAKIGQALPKVGEIPYGAQLLRNQMMSKNIPTSVQDQKIMEYMTAPDEAKKAEIGNKIIKDIAIEYPDAAKNALLPSSKSDIASNALGVNNYQPTSNQQSIQQYVPPTQIGIPSTGFVPAPDTETYQLGGYNLPQQQQQQQQQVTQQPVVKKDTPNLTQDYINNNSRLNNVNNYLSSQKINNFEERYNNISNEYKEKFGLNNQGLLSGQKLSIKQLQTLKNEAPQKLQGSAKNINELNELHQNLSQLVYHKGFETLYSKGGDIAALVDNDAINARKLFQKIQKTIGKIDLVQMKLDSPNGATPFGQLNFSELQMMLDSITEAEFGGSPDAAKNAFFALSKKLGIMKENIRDFSNLIYADENDNSWSTYGPKINYSYQESPMLEGLDGEKILTGSVMNSHTGTSKFDINKYYFMSPNDNGQYDTVQNSVTGKTLTIDDIRNNRYK